MKSPSTLFLIVALLLATLLPSAVAGKVKGLKAPSSTTTHRNLQDTKEKGEKEKKAKSSIPKVKVRGPESRTCKTSSKPNEVKIECGTRAGKAKATKEKPAENKAATAKATEEKETATKDDAKAKKGTEDKEPKARTIANGNAPQEEEANVEATPGEEDASRGITLTPSEKIRDSIKYVVKTDRKGIRVALEYKQEVENENSANKTETEFELLFESLVEYVKGSEGWFDSGVNTEAYNWASDEIIQVIPLSNWDGIPGITEAAGGVVKYFTASASLTSPEVAIGPTGTTYFNFTVSEATVGELMSANSMKIDVRILNFPWQRSDSYIALMSTVDSKKKVELSYDDEALVSGGKSKLTEEVFVTFDEEMQSLGLEAFGAYTWENNAEATTADDPDSDVAVARGGSGRRRRRAQEEEGTPAVVEDVSAKPTGAPPVEVEHVEGSITTIEVVATSPEEQEIETENHQQIAYSFVGDSAHSAAEIYWDPEAGVGYGEAPVSAAALLLHGVSWTGAIVAGLFSVML